ncbi:MAG: transcription termination/antitermination NusG family protein, partial [Deltaproteobacteria bacterium]|nr:transcription termination/antitermination NusG family protein [Deltaproteobacteria bacterium]
LTEWAVKALREFCLTESLFLPIYQTFFWKENAVGVRRWYVAQSKPHKELLVCKHLGRAFERKDILFPQIRRGTRLRPLFPSYLFFRTVIEVSENYRNIKYARGVLRILGDQNHLAFPVADEVIEVLQNRIDANGIIDQSHMMRVGQPVRVRIGPLKDLIGILEKPVSDDKRVQVLFKLLRYPLRAMLSIEDLEQIGA